MSDKLIITYRDNAALVSNSKQEFGLILAPRPEKPKPKHRCQPPGPLYCLWMWLTSRSITKNSLWRCNCGKFWWYIGQSEWDCWKQEKAQQIWEEMGGYISQPDRQKKNEEAVEEDEDEDEDD